LCRSLGFHIQRVQVRGPALEMDENAGIGRGLAAAALGSLREAKVIGQGEAQPAQNTNLQQSAAMKYRVGHPIGSTQGHWFVMNSCVFSKAHIRSRKPASVSGLRSKCSRERVNSSSVGSRDSVRR